MAGPETILEFIDSGLASLLASWNSYTTDLATALLAVFIYKLWSAQDPDAHPYVLARQAAHRGVRMPGQSPVFTAPHDPSLLSGLNLRGQRGAKFARGWDGDLRDVWRQVLKGAELRTPSKSVEDVKSRKGNIMTVAEQQVVSHDSDEITRQILLVGQHLTNQGSSRVAIHLPNSFELLIVLFACAFQPSLSPILIPFGVSSDALTSMLGRSRADTIITAPGAASLVAAFKSCPGLRQAVWLADEGNPHLDVSSGAGATNIGTWTWANIVEQPFPEGLRLSDDTETIPQDLTMFWPVSADGQEEMVRFSHANLVSGIAGQVAALPSLGPADTFLPADSLARTHTLVVTLAALFSNASVALNAAVTQDPDLLLATTMSPGFCPTVIVATPTTLLKAHAAYESKRQTSFFERVMHWRKERMLRQGCMPAGSAATAPFGAASGLRLIIAAHRAGSGTTPVLTQAVLSDLRAATGARIVYAMTTARVAGTVTQTKAFDYRVEEDGSVVHFGAPPRCVAYFLKDTTDMKSRDDAYRGEIFAQGPCVIGGETGLGVLGTIRADNTLACNE